MSCVVAERFLALGTLTLSKVDYVICSPLHGMTGKAYERWKKKTIMIQGVPERLLDSLIILLESRKKGGGPVRDFKRDNCSGLVTVTFAEKSGKSLLLALKHCLVCFQTDEFRRMPSIFFSQSLYFLYVLFVNVNVIC